MAETPSLADLRAALAGLDAPALLRELVRTPSHTGLPRREEAVVRVLSRYLDAHGVPSRAVEIEPGRPNLMAAIKGRAGGRHLLLCGHTDTVAPNAGAAADPFAAETRGGRLFGRGAADMKGALAAMAAAMAALKKLGRPSAGAVTLAAVIDEEMESLGAEALIQSGFQADAAVVGEPTGNRVALGHKGLEWLEIEFAGKAAHGGAASSGVNAISAAARFVRLVEEELVPTWRGRAHPLLGEPTVNMGTISGGDQPSTVAERCRLCLDRRWVPCETVGQVFDEFEALLGRVRAAQPGLKTRLRRMPGGMATMVHGPLETPAGHPLARAAFQARRLACGEGGAPTAFQAWSDGALLWREARIPAIVLGPGDLSLAHGPQESVPLAEVEEAALLYALLALDFCPGG